MSTPPMIPVDPSASWPTSREPFPVWWRARIATPLSRVYAMSGSSAAVTCA